MVAKLLRTNADTPAAAVLAAARPLIEARGGALPARVLQADDAQLPYFDYAQVDPELFVDDEPDQSDEGEPPPGSSYAGMGPAWRYRYRQWLLQPDAPAPPVFHELLVAAFETALLEVASALHTRPMTYLRDEIADHLVAIKALVAAPAWSGRPALLLDRASLLTRVLTTTPAGWHEWWIAPGTSPALRDLALGQQARLGLPLTAEQLALLVNEWEIAAAPVPPQLAALRLLVLRGAEDRDPLQAALATLGAAAETALPWRMVHRDLRLALPQPALRPLLEPQLREAFAGFDAHVELAAAASPAADASDAPPEPEPPPKPARGAPKRKKPAETDKSWQLVVEFANSRSEYFAAALLEARKMASYVAILDEKRELVHRVVYDRKQQRAFWHLWYYIMKWNGSRAYLNGKLLEPYEIYPWAEDFDSRQVPWRLFR